MLIFIRLLTIFACLYLEHPLFPRRKMALLDTNDPHFFNDDIPAAREEDEAVVEDFYEAATDVEDRGSVSAESNEGVEEHEGGDDLGFDEDDEHAEDDVCDDHWGVGVAQSMSGVPPEEEASNAKAERYLQTKRNFNQGVGNRNAVGKAVRYTPPMYVKCRTAQMVQDGMDLETIRQKIWDVTAEKVFIFSQRQLNNWCAAFEKVQGMVVPRNTRRVGHCGRKAKFAEGNSALWAWFRDRNRRKLSVSVSLLRGQAETIGAGQMCLLMDKWLQRFRQRHRIALRKSQHRTQLSPEEGTKRFDGFYTHLYVTPKGHKVFIYYDEKLAALAGMLRQLTTLDIRSNTNVLVHAEEKHFKHMGTLLAALAVREEGDKFVSVPINPAIILKCHKPKTIANPHQLLVTTNATGVINSVYMRDQYVPYLVDQLKKSNADALVVMNSASAHISPAVLAAFCVAGVKYAIIPGGLTSFIQAIDLALAALYRACHHQLYMEVIKKRGKSQLQRHAIYL